MITCPHCNASMDCPPGFAGKQVSCPKCGGHFTAAGGVAVVSSPAMPVIRSESPSRSTSSIARRGPVLKYEGLLVTFAGVGCACLVLLVFMGFAWEMRYQKMLQDIKEASQEIERSLEDIRRAFPAP